MRFLMSRLLTCVASGVTARPHVLRTARVQVLACEAHILLPVSRCSLGNMLVTARGTVIASAMPILRSQRRLHFNLPLFDWKGAFA